MPQPAFTLTIDRADASRLGRDILFGARMTIVNASGAPVTAYTNFGSIFDGLRLVVTDPGGTELVRHGYVDHQSPYAEHRPIVVPAGATTQEIGVPVWDLPQSATRVLVRFEGTLPGLQGGPALRSNTLAVQVPPRE